MDRRKWIEFRHCKIRVRIVKISRYSIGKFSVSEMLKGISYNLSESKKNQPIWINKISKRRKIYLFYISIIWICFYFSHYKVAQSIIDFGWPARSWVVEHCAGHFEMFIDGIYCRSWSWNNFSNFPFSYLIFVKIYDDFPLFSGGFFSLSHYSDFFTIKITFWINYECKWLQ